VPSTSPVAGPSNFSVSAAPTPSADPSVDGGRSPFAKQLEDLQPASNFNQSKTPGEGSVHGSRQAAVKKESAEPSASCLAVLPFIPLPQQPQPISFKFSLLKDGFQDADLKSRRGAASALDSVTATPQAAVAGITISPLGTQDLTTETAPQITDAAVPREAVSKPEAPINAEAALADLAVAVNVKSQSSPAPTWHTADTSAGAAVRIPPAKEARRVDLEDIPQAAALRGQALRSTVWTSRDASPGGASHELAEPPTSLTDRLETTPVRGEGSVVKAAGPLKDLLLQVGQTNQERVDIRMTERAGELHVAVRAASADVAHGLRQALPELVGRLEQSGYRTEAWRPSGVVSAPGPASETRQSSSEFRNTDSQSQPGWSQQQRGHRQHEQPDRPKWVEELEGSVAAGAEKLTGEFHGFSR
jgi:hypothetical protein